MATKVFSSFARGLNALRSFTNTSKDPLTQCFAPQFTRSMATEVRLYPSIMEAMESNEDSETASDTFNPSVLTTIYKFPEMEPLRFETYPGKHLHLPLRRDLLHRAVIFEGDGTRQGTASSKTRWEVHGSHRKIRPQKGTGRARLGTRQNPNMRGGGKSFGPHPRDFSTELPRKMYDLAWRTALSYRYKKGELIVCEDGMDLQWPKTRSAKAIFEKNGWGNENGRTLVITASFRKNLMRAVRHCPEDGRVEMVRDVDVKDLLELGRLVVEKRALDEMLKKHESDLVKKVRSAED